MALFQSPAFSSLLHNSNADTQDIPLSSAVPSAQSCIVSQIIGFPASLAALRHGVRWNASCWVANQRLDDFEQLQIGLYAFRGQQRAPHIEWCHFASDSQSKVEILIVFPELATSFRTQDVMEKWTDMVVLPAFHKLGLSAGVLSSNFNVIKMNAEAEREQSLNVNAPDTPLIETLTKKGGMSSEDMHNLWTLIRETSNTMMYPGFRNLFLVARCRQQGILTTALPLEEAWRSITAVWDSALDSRFTPLESIRANATVTMTAQAAAPNMSHAANVRPRMSYQPSTDSIWESSRKRKADENGEADKRSRGDFEQQVLSPGEQGRDAAGDGEG